MWKNNPNYTYSVMAPNKLCITVPHSCTLNNMFNSDHTVSGRI